MEEVEELRREPVHSLRSKGPLRIDHFLGNEVKKSNSSELCDSFPERKGQKIKANKDVKIKKLHSDKMLLNDNSITCKYSDEHKDDSHPG